MKPKLPLVDRYNMPHASQMHSGPTDDQTLGGCFFNGILLVICLVVFLALVGGH